jgi:hypothetical protein
LLAAPLLIASVDYINHADLGFHATSYYLSAHLPTQGLPQLVLPYIYGPIFGYADPKFVLPTIWGDDGGYLSTSLLLFALIGLFSSSRRGLRLVLLIWIALVLARIYGEPPLVGDVLGVLPGMSRVAFFRYATASLELPVVILAALGLDQLAARPAPRLRLAWMALLSIALVGAAAIAARPLAHQLGPVFSHRPYFRGAVAWGTAVVIAGAVLALVRNSRARTGLLALLVACDAVVLFMVPELSAPRSVRTDLAPVAFLQRHLSPTSRFFTLGPLQPNYGAYFGVASLNINDIPIPSAFAHYVKRRLDAVVDPTVFVGNSGGFRSPFLPSAQHELLRNLAGYRNAGVTYVLTPAHQALPQSPNTLRLVYRSPSTWIYHLAGAVPYFTPTSPGCRLRIENREAVRLSCRTPAVLIRRETDLAGWSAQIDGRPARVRQADGFAQAVRVGAGAHRITFDYAPPNIGWGLLAFVAGCAWMLAAPLASKRQARTALA